MAEVGDVGPATLGDLPDRLAGASLDLHAVQLKSDARGLFQVAGIDLTTRERARFSAGLGALGVGAPGGGFRRCRGSAGIFRPRGPHHYGLCGRSSAIGSVSIIAGHLQSPLRKQVRKEPDHARQGVRGGLAEAADGSIPHALRHLCQ